MVEMAMQVKLSYISWLMFSRVPQKGNRSCCVVVDESMDGV